eukprot:TRINITY_DN32233_c0_g1_i1.p1 TRINITY_DN32233_c0_g1~~TRINITY_DN32233_c0_g1_i1.p1  ORF type:complete len:129 (+),score=29.48 TRINITY_DN32233_c0_g1_i1:49-435(+)
MLASESPPDSRSACGKRTHDGAIVARSATADDGGGDLPRSAAAAEDGDWQPRAKRAGAPGRTAVVNCRGTRFETSPGTLANLGPCYLSMQAEIDTTEPIYLDFSVAAFQIVLDALTVAQVDLRKPFYT